MLEIEIKLEFYEMVNSCETIEELVSAIEEIGYQYDGLIPGRSRFFKSIDQIRNAKLFYSNPDMYNANIVTRSFGLRQQLIYITYYTILNK